MIKEIKTCDVCETEVKNFNESPGNISRFGVKEACDDCYDFLYNNRDEFDRQSEKAIEDLKKKFIERCKKNGSIPSNK